MSDKNEELRRRFQELLPLRDELQKGLETQRRMREQLQSEIREMKAELEARKRNEGPQPWPGALEPLVLAAAFVIRGGDIDSIAEKVTELSSRPYSLFAIRSTVHRLVRRELLSETERIFTVTPPGERELAQARDDAKRWVGALEEATDFADDTD